MRVHFVNGPLATQKINYPNHEMGKPVRIGSFFVYEYTGKKDGDSFMYAKLPRGRRARQAMVDKMRRLGYHPSAVRQEPYRNHYKNRLKYKDQRG